jgi:hypothetical protein
VILNFLVSYFQSGLFGFLKQLSYFKLMLDKFECFSYDYSDNSYIYSCYDF